MLPEDDAVHLNIFHPYVKPSRRHLTKDHLPRLGRQNMFIDIVCVNSTGAGFDGHGGPPYEYNTPQKSDQDIR